MSLFLRHYRLYFAISYHRQLFPLAFSISMFLSLLSPSTIQDPQQQALPPGVSLSALLSPCSRRPPFYVNSNYNPYILW